MNDGAIDPPRVGSVLDERWRLEEYLAGGGMGTVWRATDLRLEESVAVKVMKPSVANTREAGERFRLEAKAIARLRGPCVVSILDFNVDQRTQAAYIVMELLRGEDLRRRLQHGRLSYLQMTAVIADVCTAMRRAHDLGIVHRDLKPANVFLVEGSDGTRCKVLDFGLAKLMVAPGADAEPLTNSDRIPGTIHYMSPEQINRPRGVDRRTDVWAIGVLAYECVTGQRPFAGESEAEIILRICQNRPIPPSRHLELPAGFDRWFAKATALEVEHRFHSTEELLAALRGLQSAPVTAAAPVSSTTLPRQAWASDANQIDIGVLREVTFLNKVVDEFLHDDNRRFVCGAKGVGKTLLLSYKRALLSERHQGDVRFIPEGRPYLDLMGDLRTLGKKHIDLMSTLRNCKRLWAFCLRASLLSHHAQLLAGGEAAGLDALPRDLLELLRAGGVEPTIVLKSLLGRSVGEINRIVDATENILDHKVRALHSGVYVFIDKLDQSLRGVSREAWVSMQAGLVEAAWDLMNTNSHVKVFATIREEAFSSYESDIRGNLYGAITIIRYEPEDLRGILETLTRFYEGLSVRGFLTVEIVDSASTRAEDAFGFFARHTLGRPRDLVILASELSRNRGSLDERVFKRIVREASAGILVPNVFDEVGVFLDVLRDPRVRREFLALLPWGVLTRDDLLDVSARFLGQPRDPQVPPTSEALQCWRELYDCGLLGVIDEDDEHGLVQRFRQPHEAIDVERQRLPRSPWYLLHPALQAAVARRAEDFRSFRGVVVGHLEEWHLHYEVLLAAQRALGSAASEIDREVEQRLGQVLREFLAAIADGASIADARAGTGTSSAFRSLCERLDRLRWDELHMRLIELFTADSGS
jgi:serine/threonine protein kinase